MSVGGDRESRSDRKNRSDRERRVVGTIEYDGAPAALSYGDVGAEYAAIDTGAALLDISRRRLISASGQERAEFLHGQLSADILGLQEGNGCAALLLSGQGRVVSMLEVYRGKDRLLLAVDAAWLVRAKEGLERNLVADDCEFENLPPAPAIGLAGPRAADVLRGAGFDGRLEAERYSIAGGVIGGVPVQILGRGCLRVPGFDLWCECDVESVRGELIRRGAEPVGVTAYECVRMESGIARYGADIDDSRLALEARLGWAIHFDKGCYLGQEVIERSVSRGRLKRRLSLLALDGVVAVGDPIVGGAPAEVVTSVADSPRLGAIALAYVDEPSCAQGTGLEIKTASATVAAKVMAWPRSETFGGR